MAASTTDRTSAEVSDDELKRSAVSEPFPPKPQVNRMDKPFVANKKSPEVAKHSSPIDKKRDVDDTNSNPPTKRVKVELDLPYNSIKAIKMPPRIGYVVGQVPPAPVNGTHPFGDTEDYRNSMIIHWLDERELSYGTVAVLYNKTFPNAPMTQEALRRRHIRCLERLSRRYGVKSLEEIAPVGINILRRRKGRAPHRHSFILETGYGTSAAFDQSEDASIVATSPDPSVTTTVEPPAPATLSNRFTAPYSTLQAKKHKTQQTNEFKKACIVVWKDSLNMDLRTIRNKLEDDYNWSLGLATVEKYYYQAFQRVYGVEDTASDDENDQKDEPVTMENNLKDGKGSKELADQNEPSQDDASRAEDGVNGADHGM